MRSPQPPAGRKQKAGHNKPLDADADVDVDAEAEAEGEGEGEGEMELDMANDADLPPKVLDLSVTIARTMKQTPNSIGIKTMSKRSYTPPTTTLSNDT